MQKNWSERKVNPVVKRSWTSKTLKGMILVWPCISLNRKSGALLLAFLVMGKVCEGVSNRIVSCSFCQDGMSSRPNFVKMIWKIYYLLHSDHTCSRLIKVKNKDKDSLLNILWAVLPNERVNLQISSSFNEHRLISLFLMSCAARDNIGRTS